MQMHVTENKHQNIENAIRLIRTAVKRHNPKLVVLPEMFNTMYGKQYFEDFAETIPNGETVTAMSTLARELNIYLVGGSIVERDIKSKNILYNTCCVFDTTGTMICKYRKMHLSDFEMDNEFRLRESDYFKCGTTLNTFDIDGIKVGLGIGYDLSFTELATLYRKNGVDMLIYPAVYPSTLGEMHWEQLNRTRAIDNQVYVLGVSQARNDNHYDLVQNGHSLLVDFRGRVLTRGGKDEEILYGIVGKRAAFPFWLGRDFNFIYFFTPFQTLRCWRNSVAKLSCSITSVPTSMTPSIRCNLYLGLFKLTSYQMETQKNFKKFRSEENLIKKKCRK